MLIMSAMHLSKLLRELLQTDIDVDINGLSLHADLVQPGEVFLALQGQSSHGIDYVEQAIGRGCSAVLIEDREAELSVPSIRIDGLSTHLQHLASTFYTGATQVTVIGITGTNGKTSVAHFISQLLDGLGVANAVIGTLGIEKAPIQSKHTTPDIISLYKALDYYHQHGINTAVLEASSHALDQNRIQGLNIRHAVFTNLTQDHLDYHQSWENYRTAKAKLFTLETLEQVVLPSEDENTTYFSGLSNRAQVQLYGLDMLQDIRPNAHGFLLNLDNYVFELPLLGEFNLLNTMAALTSVEAMGFAREKIIPLLAKLRSPTGRMQQINGQKIWVDYAHTPDAIAQAITTLKQHYPDHQVRIVFGCGGERDQDKRAKMGKVANDLADSIVLTNDNPRGEDPEDIVQQILSGISKMDKVDITLDRQLAIETAVKTLKEGECLLIAGKGHENTQQFGDTTLEFNDITTAQHAAN